MKQQQILALLKEATALKFDNINDPDFQRLNKIQIELTEAVYQDHEGQDPFNSRAAGFQTIVGHLFVDTFRNRPDYLPALFPVFAVLCGDRDVMILSDVDWSLLEGKH